MEHLPQVLAHDAPQEQEAAVEGEVEVEEGLLFRARAQKQEQDDLHLGLREVAGEEATMEIVKHTTQSED